MLLPFIITHRLLPDDQPPLSITSCKGTVKSGESTSLVPKPIDTQSTLARVSVLWSTSASAVKLLALSSSSKEITSFASSALVKVGETRIRQTSTVSAPAMAAPGKNMPAIKRELATVFDSALNSISVPLKPVLSSAS